MGRISYVSSERMHLHDTPRLLASCLLLISVARQRNQVRCHLSNYSTAGEAHGNPEYSPIPLRTTTTLPCSR